MRARHVRKIGRTHAGNDQTLAAMAEALAGSDNYRVLCRLVPRTSFTPSVGPTKTAILLDVETTGLDQRKSEVVELGMIKLDYLPDGRIASVRDRKFAERYWPIFQRKAWGCSATEIE